jgi:UDP-N-acetylmuramate dehydrogenase
MITIEKNSNLLPYNTFGIQVKAKFFCKITTVPQLQELIASSLYKEEARLILGGGSNILFTKDFQGLVVHNELKGIETVMETDERIVINVGAGEIWHDFVMHCVNRNWGGIENLSLIPGTVGAAPIQNIGAYGVEIANVIETVEGVDASTGLVNVFEKDECRFEYRESAFKVELKEKIFISSVTLTLTKKNHLFDIHYGALRDTLKQHPHDEITVKKISEAVIQIRQSKLPDYRKVGNAGSFFKNPTISPEQLQQLQKTYPLIPSYPSDNQNVKVPAGWLIEQCGWKGKRMNNIGVHPFQALVLVNYGGGTGEEILQLAEQIQTSVKEKFHVTLTPEVNII